MQSFFGFVARSATAAIALALVSTPALADVQWRSGPAQPTRKLAGAELSRKLNELSQPDAERRVVVRFERAITRAERTRLAGRGVRLLRSVGEHAYFATLRRGLDAGALAADGKLTRVDAIDTRWKLHPDLDAGLIRPWSIVSPASGAAGDGDATGPVIALYVLFHADFDGESGAAALLARHGAELRSQLRSVNGAVIHIAAERMLELAREDAVMYLEPPLPKFSELNDLASQVVGAATVNDPPYGLTGAGVTALIYDGGQIFAHDDFGNRLTIGQSDADGISDHATHVGGTVAGGGTLDPQYRGMAPAAGLVSYGFEQVGGLSIGFLYTNPGDMEADYTEAITRNGADVSNNSIGSNVASNGFPCEWEGDYNVTSALIDAIVGGSLGAPFRIVWAGGNERSGSARCGSSYRVIPPPSGAKNHISVGAVNSNDNQSVTGFTSWGPTDDGRVKPDVVAPGCQSGGDGGTTSTNSLGDYNVKCGTSMASPVVTGVGVLLLEHYRATHPALPDFRNALLKAILAQTAQDLEAPGPDYKTGYGLVQAAGAADLITEGRFVEATVEQNAIKTFLVDVPPGASELKLTLAWDDPSGVPNTGAALINDLDLLVTNGGGAVYHPWTLDPANPAADAVRTRRDATNNLEQVVVDSPPEGTYLVEVRGFRVSEGPSQVFGLTASHAMQGCSSAGRLSTAKDRLACSDVLGLQVVDCDLDADAGQVENTTITLTSTSEAGGESVVLTENAADSGQFSGSLTVDAAGGAGILQVEDGGVVEATYVDADDGSGGTNVTVTRQAVVDCAAPSVLSVGTSALEPSSFTVDVGLSEPGRLTVHYGTVCGSPTGTASSNLNDAHSLPLNGLDPLTTYFFTLEAADDVGNVITDDNAGACYSATTTIELDYMTEQFFSVPFDLVGSYMTLTPDQAPMPVFYDRCVGPLAGELPLDPTGGTAIQPADVLDFVEVPLAAGETVALYGQSYDTVFISWNGHVVLGQPGSETSEAPPTDAGDFFSKPRIAALTNTFRTPYPATTVSFKQLEDRFAVTWENVIGDTAADYDSLPSTFQLELFFDGRIRMSWLSAEIAADNRWTGISGGGGEPTDWAEEDLSGTGSCNARPPFAPGRLVETPTDAPLAIVLDGSDDALPPPPDLSYSITRLPALGTLIDDGTGTAISSVPHELDSGGNSVSYVPHSGHYGDDLFEYTVDDGGTAPQGGKSAPGIVQVSLGIDTLFEFLVDDTDPGWLADPLWAFGQPTGNGSDGGEDPTGGATGLHVLGYNLDGDYEDGLTARYLRSSPLNLVQADDTRLEFQRWLNVSSGASDTAAVLVSDSLLSLGSPVWEVGDYTLRESNWFPTHVDISSIADRRPLVLLRWGMGPTGPLGTMGGWNIDDIRLRGHVVQACGAEPAEAAQLSFDENGTSLVWSVAPFFGGERPTYDVLRSTTFQDFGSGASCLATGLEGTQATDLALPPPGTVYYYLVRGQNECGTGSVGTQSSGAPRTAPGCS